ncbi:MAG: manganese efflux pump MntP family protein [Actinomycetota bacterium]|nr:manganese efflux pump MntP family protein [Actinomycetota bacterium]
MNLLRLFAFVLPLGLDTFAVASAIGLGGLTRGQRWRISLVFGVCEGATPAVGLLLGGPLGSVLGTAADYAAVTILVAFGVFTLLRRDDGESLRASRMAAARGPALLLLGLSVSLDETAIGFTLGLLRLPVVPVLVAIGVQAFAVAQLGFALGAALSERLRGAAQRLAGIALIVLGLVLLVERLVR